jgi:hypothetical protein
VEIWQRTERSRMFGGEAKYVESATTSRGNQTNFDKEHGFLSSWLPDPHVAHQNLKQKVL